jgi:O-antigen ligase/polysaccharide polymerase Wzy-like membrane protein
VATARTPLRWGLAAALALLMEYACLTTFSRGVALAAAVSLVVLYLLLRGQPRAGPWRRWADIGLVVVLLLEAAAMFGSDSYLLARMRTSTHDFGSRLEHWRHGVGLLQGPLDWAFGKGLGRLPSAYGTTVAEHELSGAAQVVTRDGEDFLRLAGPRRIEALAGMHALTQRIPSRQSGVYRASFDARVARPAQLNLSVCEIHLLYEARCQHGFVRLLPDGTRWRSTELTLEGPPPGVERWPPRMKVFALSVLDAGAVVELDNLVLRDTGSANLLRNGDFSGRMARWFPAAQHYFVPWHIDNLALELLIEQGMVGLAIFASLFAAAAGSLLSARRRGLTAAACVLAGLAGAWTVGLVSSVLDVPRVAFLLLFLSALALALTKSDPAGEHRRWA